MQDEDSGWPSFDAEAQGPVLRASAAARRLGIEPGMAVPEAGALLCEVASGLRWTRHDEGHWRCEPAQTGDAAEAERRAVQASTRLREEVRHRRWLEQQLMSATETEQRRISLELHDGLGQHLSGLAYTARSMAETLAAEGHAQAGEADWLARLLRDAVGRVRAMSRGLWPVGLERHSLPRALASLASDVEQLFRVSVQVHADGFEVESAPAAHHLFRIAQEAMHNAIKHGQARHIEIRLDRAPPEAMLSIVSDGAPLDPEALKSAQGIGLIGMRLRADALGGDLSIESLPAGGVEVCLVWKPGQPPAALPRPEYG